MYEKHKAYVTTNEHIYYVCFAESATKARSTIFNEYTSDILKHLVLFTDLRVRRVPELDSYYRGETFLDWEHPRDRMGLVGVLQYSCFEPDRQKDCVECSAKHVCDDFAAYMEENR